MVLLVGMGNALIFGAEGPRFKSRAAQIGHGVANGLPLLRQFFRRRNNTELNPADSFHASA